MMDRRKIAELRIFLVRSQISRAGSRESCDLSDAIYPHAGELLALADAALKIRQAYRQFDRHGKENSAFSAMGMLSLTVVSAMRELDDLEAAAKTSRRGAHLREQCRTRSIARECVLSKTRKTANHHLVLWAAACHDLRTALYLAKNPEMTVNNIGFHLQQAVEKSLKAYLSKSRISYPLTHELIRLFSLIESRTAIPPQFDILKMLTPFAGGLRRELPMPPDDFDVGAAINLTQEFLEWVSSFGGF